MFSFEIIYNTRVNFQKVLSQFHTSVGKNDLIQWPELYKL